MIRATFNFETEDMSVPQGAFAARKVRQNQDLLQNCSDLNLTQYNEKYMNSVWGMYNRYSVHNLKKIMNFNSFALRTEKESKAKEQKFLPTPAFL